MPEAEKIFLRRFPGLRPYASDERALFFGRENESDNLYYSVLSNKVTLLYGQSGSGKSSLINCALIPRLMADSVSVVWLRVVAQTEKGTPGLTGHVLPTNADEPSTISLELGDDATAAPAKLLAETIAGIIPDAISADGNSNTVIVLLDQFEEVFDKLEPATQHRVMDFLADLRQERTFLWHVLLSLRSEYVGHLAILAEYVRGVFDSPIHVQPLAFEQARAVLHRTARASRTGSVGNAQYELDSDPFILDDEAVDLILEECATNVEAEAVNLLLLQVIGRALVEQFVKKLPEGPKRAIDSKLLTPGWFKDTKKKNFELVLESAFADSRQRKKSLSILERMVTDSGRRQIVRRSEIIDSKTGEGASIVGALVHNDVIREERVFSDRRYEISHDFVADAVWRKAQRRRRILTFVQSAAGVGIFLLAIGLTGSYLEGKKAEIKSRNAELSLLKARYDDVEEQLDGYFEQFAELDREVRSGEERLRELNESNVLQAADNCRLQHRLFMNDWANGAWGEARSSLQRTLDACNGAAVFSPGALTVLHGALTTAFSPPAVSARLAAQSQLPKARPSWLRSRREVVTHEMVPYKLVLEPTTLEFDAVGICDEDPACSRQAHPVDRFQILAKDGGRWVVHICDHDASGSQSSTASHLLSSEPCNSKGGRAAVDMRRVAEVMHPMVAKINSAAGDYFVIGRPGQDLACGLDGYCVAFLGTENQRAMITSLAAGYRVTVGLSETSDAAVLFAADQDGYIYRYRLEYESCDYEDCPLPGLRPEAHLEWFIRGHEQRINSIRLAKVDDVPMLFSASTDGTVLARDQRSLEMLSVFTGEGGESIEAVFVDSTDDDAVRIVGLSDNWQLFEWKGNGLLVTLHPIPQLIPHSVAIDRSTGNNLFVGGVNETILESGQSEGRPAVMRITSDRIEDCALPIRPDEGHLSVERMAISPDSRTVAAAMGHYGNNDGALALSQADSEVCEFQQIGRRTMLNLGGAVHGIDFYSNEEFVASDFRGNLWRAVSDGEKWDVSGVPLFDSERRITAVSANLSSERVFVGVRQRTRNGSADPACLLDIPYARLWTDQPISDCDAASSLGGTSLPLDGGRGTLRWVTSNSSGSQIAVSGNDFVETLDTLDTLEPESSSSLEPTGIVTWRAAYALNDEVLIGATFAGTLEIWDVKSGINILSFRLPVSDKSDNALLDLAVNCERTGTNCRVAVPLKTERSVVVVNLAIDPQLYADLSINLETP